MKKILVLFVLLTVGAFAQNTWTTNYYLARIATGTLNWADTLNNNWTLVDAAIKLRADTINTVKADFYTEHGYNGVHQDNKLTLSMLQTAEKAKLVQTTGTQMVGGFKTFDDGINVSTWFHLQAEASTNSGSMWFTPTSYDELMFRNTTAVDTIPDKAWVRTNYVSTANAQTVSGSKTFSGITTFSNTVTANELVTINAGIVLDDDIISYDSLVTPGVIDITDMQFARVTATGASSLNVLDGGFYTGQILIIKNDGAPTILLYETGNLVLAGNYLMGLNDTIMLIYVSAGAGSRWYEVSRSDN